MLMIPTTTAIDGTGRPAAAAATVAADQHPATKRSGLMPASEKSALPVLCACLFAETEPEQLVKELSALSRISPDTAFRSPERMEQLKSLYEKVRCFQFEE